MGLRRIQPVINRVSMLANIICEVTIVAMMLLIVTDVFLRKFATGVMGAVEISELMLLVIGFFGFSYCWVQGRHIRIELFVEIFPDRVQSAFMAFGSLVGLVFFGAMTWGSIRFVFDAYKKADVTPILMMPVLPVKSLVMVGCCIFCLNLIYSTVYHTLVSLGKLEKGG